MLKIAICDDEKIFAKKLETIISDYMKSRQLEAGIDIYCLGTEFAELDIKMAQYDIVFLDINMAGLDGLQTAQKIREFSKECFIVFVTAFIEYSVAGYSVEAIRYILKGDPNLKEVVEESLSTICRKLQYNLELFSFPFWEGTKNINLDKILYIESEVHTLKFHIMEEDYLIYSLRETLSNYEELFANNGFVRIHQSYLVNLKYITELDSCKARMKNGDVLPIARQRFKEVRQRYISCKGDMEWHM